MVERESAAGGRTRIRVLRCCGQQSGRRDWPLPVPLDLLQVSATFAASLVTSPAIGAYLGRVYGDSLVVVLATAIALLDICFILVAVPESLPEKMRPASWGAPISWEQADPFAVKSSWFSFSLAKKVNVWWFSAISIFCRGCFLGENILTDFKKYFEMLFRIVWGGWKTFWKDGQVSVCPRPEDDTAYLYERLSVRL